MTLLELANALKPIITSWFTGSTTPVIISQPTAKVNIDGTDIAPANVTIDGTGNALRFVCRSLDNGYRNVIWWISNNVAGFSGDDHDDQGYSFVSGWTDPRVHNAYIRVYGAASGATLWDEYAEISHSGSDGLVTTGSGALRLGAAASAVVPQTDAAVSLGTAASRWKTVTSSSDISAKPAGAGIALNPNGATGDYTVYLTPNNLTGNRRWYFSDYDGTAAGGAGTSTVSSTNSLATQNHTHAVTSSSAPGAAAAILATNASGQVATIGFGARVYNSASLGAGDAVWTTLTFDSERFDTNSIHSTSTSTNRLTCNTAGYYAIFGSVTFAASANGVRQIAITYNGTATIALQGTLSLGNVAVTPLTISSLYYLAATDYVELGVYQNSGSTIPITAGGNYSPEFAMMRMG